MAEVAAVGWDVEIIPRHSKELLILYKDGDARGSVEVFSVEEKEQWIRAIGEIDRPLLPKHISGMLINGLSPQGNEPTTSGPSSEPSTPNSPTGTSSASQVSSSD
jgi:hypothetical protein